VTTIRLRVEPATGEPFERESDGGEIVIGRAAPADVLLADHLVSRRHARLFEREDGWMVEDLGARNGTVLNGQALSEPRHVQPGDVIKVGSTRVRLLPLGRPTEAAHAAPLGDGRVGSSIFRSAAALARLDEPTDAGSATIGQAARLRALNDFHRGLAGAISLDELLELLLERLFAVLEPEEGLVLLRAEDGTLSTAASRRLPGATGPLLVSRRLTEEVVEKGTAAVVFDVADDSRFAAAQSVVAAGVRSILAAPIGDPSGCLGMIALYSRAHVRRFGEEDLELLVSLASAAALRIRNVALAEAAAARRVLEHELALAHDIQMAMLPRTAPDRPEIELGARLAPARAIGGDLYDYAVAGDAFWFIVADAAGKGVGAALFMAMTRALFRAAIGPDETAASVLERMNAGLSRDNERQVFVTAVVGRVLLATGELSWCSAGHMAPLRATAAGRVEELQLPRRAIALGILEEAPYEEHRARLAPGDLLLLYTDGVTEAVDAAGRLFSLEQLERAVRSTESRPAQDLVDSIAAEVRAFAGEMPQEDDITLLALRFRGVRAAV
jgi:serine phosphatase RsbU (regulator of sigma subunit)